jgi:tRNA pseudouridine38-40 synthase
VQGALESAIALVTRENASVVGAGRTDSGVHAIGQVIHFQTESVLPDSSLQLAINASLPRAVRITQLEEADASFHARFSARSREYRYLVENAPVASPLWRDRAFHVVPQLDVEAMEEATELLRGRHDFAAFGSPMVHTRADTQGQALVKVHGGTERVMFVASCWRQARFVHFRFVADAFLRRMVRMIVGTLVRIGSGALVLKTIARLLQGDRSIFAGPAVPAHGLYLVRIRY